MALLLGRDKVFLRNDDGIDRRIVIEQNSNLLLHEYFKELACRLELSGPKSPDEVYKKFLEPSESFTGCFYLFLALNRALFRNHRV